MIRPIVTWPDPVLNTMCIPVGAIDDSVRALAADMFETMYDAPGRGLAAPQVGEPLRMFVMDVGWKEGAPTPITMINPEIIWQSDTQCAAEEGCLSIPGVLAEVTRPAEVTMRWTDLTGRGQERTLGGFEATCAQHELDHLNGVITFDRVAPEARAVLEKAYAA